MDITNLQVRITRDLIEIEKELEFNDSSISRTETLLNIKNSLESALDNLAKLKIKIRIKNLRNET